MKPLKRRKLSIMLIFTVIKLTPLVSKLEEFGINGVDFYFSARYVVIAIYYIMYVSLILYVLFYFFTLMPPYTVYMPFKISVGYKLCQYELNVGWNGA